MTRLAFLRMLGIMPVARYGSMGQMHRRPDQQTDAPPSAVAPTQAAGILRARLVIIFGTGPNVGLFVYSGSPASGNLVASIAAAPGTDPHGNAYLAGVTTYTTVAPFVAIRTWQSVITFFTASSQAGPWTQSAAEGLYEAAITSMGLVSINPGGLNVGGATGDFWLPASGDTTGATDKANINAILALGSGSLNLLPGTYYINGPLVMAGGSGLRGAGRNATTISTNTTGAAFTGSQMVGINRSAQVTDLTLSMPSATISSNPNADGILLTQGGGFLHDVTVESVTFSQVNGWCIRITDDGTSGAPVGLWFRNLTGSGSGGYGIFGAQRTMGAFFENAGLGAIGGTSTTLDGLFAQDVFDLDFDGCWFNAASGTNTGHAIHLKGHVNAFRFVRAELGGPGTAIAGSGSVGLLCEDNVNGQPSQITFIGHNPFQGYDIGASLQGSCFDIVFIGCEFNKNNTHGVVVNTTGVGIEFHGCKWAGPGAFASNGQAGPTLHGTYHDLHWQSTAHGRIANCEFRSSIVAVSSVGVQASVDFVAFAGVAAWLTDPLFTGTGSTVANQVVNRPQYMRAPLITGTAVLAAGTVTVTAAYLAVGMRIELRYVTPGGTPGAVFVSAFTAGTSFVIKSTSATDTSTIEYEVLQ